MNLPRPADLTSLVLRTDFTDASVWSAVREALHADDRHVSATCVSDPRFDGVSVQALTADEPGANEDDPVTALFLADCVTMADPAYPLLAVDLADQPGRTFRVAARHFHDVSANLSIANMDFADFADAADETGTYRGFGE
ncbi:hypothetical protein ABT255_47900 [Streptomyces mirabilis]|uniref:DUF6924 domain-containing protein n=1 Tax=Streptomyces mirabilis TaxID=68239 RepID=UPI0033242211